MPWPAYWLYSRQWTVSMILREYTDYTMRGSKSELTLDKDDVNQKKSTGLDIDYAYDWSYGKAESGTLLIPWLRWVIPPARS